MIENILLKSTKNTTKYLTVGGIGVSEGHYIEDMEVAEAALKAI